MSDSTADMKPCPVCGEDIKTAAQKCRHCGEDLAVYAKRKDASVEKSLYRGGVPFFYDAMQIVVLIILTLLFIVPGLIYLIARWIESASTKYNITSQRLGIEKGILSKSGENIELFRVDDFGINEPWGMRLMGYAYLVFKSSDRTSRGSSVVIMPKKEADVVASQIREAIFTQRDLRGIKTYTNA